MAAGTGTEERRDAVELSDARAIRALAHPARLAVIEALYERGLQLTATQAATLVGTTPSAMSYHLRALERYGMVRRAASGGDGRERPWVRAAKDLTIRPEGATASRATLAATGAVVAVAMDVLSNRLLDALGSSDPIAGFSTATVHVTEEELKGLTERLRQLFEPYRDETREDVPEGALRASIAYVVVREPDAPVERVHERPDEEEP